MNVLSTTIKDYTFISIKGCKEIKFSTGGHMFIAALSNNNNYQVCNFYTADAPQNLLGKNHSSKVRGVDWFDDDMGFTTVG